MEQITFETFEISKMHRVHLDGFYTEAAPANEDDAADAHDAHLQEITMQGHRVIDTNLTVDLGDETPVYGWVLWEEGR